MLAKSGFMIFSVSPERTSIEFEEIKGSGLNHGYLPFYKILNIFTFKKNTNILVLNFWECNLKLDAFKVNWGKNWGKKPKSHRHSLLPTFRAKKQIPMREASPDRLVRVGS